jgi:DNA-binding MarR family transcriptional regulator
LASKAFSRAKAAIDGGQAGKRAVAVTEAASPDSFGYLLRRLQLLYKKNFVRIAKDDLPTGQVGVLMLIGQNSDITPTRISARLGMEPAQVAVLVSKLELQGLIRRAASNTDGRVRPLRLTAKGQRQYALTCELAAEAEQSFIGDALNEKETRQLHALLSKLLAKHI